ncbi:hypothetical protein [Jeotgalibacillus terrae]|uniref:Uncharacterized protein n=1 Tax=Jeotgalibacillus terrae TaxID=587735 RepID=A0ABW5ZEE4_9BACL|nr:hypothetical protein [Jeotgalibacillus terrae]MBM7577688.1 hypothetical protein [Jeotgalibacillus terrae]
MGQMSQDEINVDLFEEVQRLQKEVNHYKELANLNVDAYYKSQNKLEIYEKAVKLALMTLEDNNLMNDSYWKIHSILDNG